VIPHELESLLEPLERFEAIRRTAVRHGDRLADLSYANPYEGARRGVREALRAALDDERALDLQYTPFGGAVLSRRAVADSLRDAHGIDFAFGDVVLTPGAAAALQLALRTASAPGGEVLVPVPCWHDYPLYARFAGLEPRLIQAEPATLGIDLEALAAAASGRTGAVLLSHPANPTGRAYDPGFLTALGDELRRIEDRHGCELTLIADETHRDFADPDEYRSAAHHFDRTILVYSFGKYHHVQGQRLGYAAVSPLHPRRDEVARELVRWTRVTGFVTPTALMQRAIPRLLALHHDRAGLAEARERVVAGLAAAGCDAVTPGCTLFVYARTPRAFADDFGFASELARRGVLVLPAPVFHHHGHFRVALTGTSWMIDRALNAIEEVADVPARAS
jgi:aspartate aminotransferase